MKLGLLLNPVNAYKFYFSKIMFCVSEIIWLKSRND